MSPFPFKVGDRVAVQGYEDEPGVVLYVGLKAVFVRWSDGSENSWLPLSLVLVPEPFFEVGKVYGDIDGEKFMPKWVGKSPGGKLMAVGLGWWSTTPQNAYAVGLSDSMYEWTEVEK